MPAPSPAPSYVRSGDISLAVLEHSPRGGGRPTVVLVHGYPDYQGTWDALVAELPLDDWHVVTYDVRGAGGSDTPARQDGYRTERLVDDLVAVLDVVLADGEAVHLVGHDWGSVQLWDAVAAEATDPRLTGRIASFTTISGPSLDHYAWLSRHRSGRQVRLANQALHSWYVAAFQLPVLPELLWQRGWRQLARSIEKGEGLPRGHFGAALAKNGTNGLNLYRANVFSRLRQPGRVHTDVPVLVIHPEDDAFLTDVLLEGLDEVASDLRVERVDAGHWMIVTQASQVAGLVREHVAAHAG
jgi:pimeloyl-ACP methyl ester carboxylesterase